jgi:argininosuccinate lyase
MESSGIELIALLALAVAMCPLMVCAQVHTNLKGSPEMRFGRVKKDMAPEYKEFLDIRERPQESLDPVFYNCQMLIHRAHVVMLVEQDILSKEEGRAILKGLKQVAEAAEGNEIFKSYMATEDALVREIGSLGGKMHIGRSRNDLVVTEKRIYYRDQVNRLIGALIEFQKALSNKARQEINTIMPGYTHRRQAQPVTFGHYLMAQVEAAGRSVDRLEDVYKRTNQSTLGAAALAGTGWPINRNRTMELLGFDALVQNTWECIGAWDFIAELASAIAIHMSNLGRLAGDLQIWSSDEYGLIDIDESYAGTSSIMPQKKNPKPLELVKLSANESLGTFVSILSSLNGMEYGFSLERKILDPYIVDITVTSTRAMAGLVSTISPLKERMLFLASKGFSTMTELADILVRNCRISFREAHEVIAQTVMRAIAEGKTADQITADLVQQSALEVMGKEVFISNEDILSALDPTENVKKRDVVGGPAPKAVQNMIDSAWKKIRSQEASHKARLRKLESAHKRLEKAECEIAESGDEK